MESWYAKTCFSCNILSAMVWAREWGCFSKKGKKWRKGLYLGFWRVVRKDGSGVSFLRVGAPQKWV